MVILPRFTKSSDDSRPYNSHRYDVFGPKLNRSLTLFGRAALDTWILLEADPNVICYCERPIGVPDEKPKRIIDFWARSKNGEEFLFLLSNSEETKGLGKPDSIPAFTAWAQHEGISLSFVNPDLNPKPKFLLANWGWIIRDISAFGKFCSPTLVENLFKSIRSPISFANLAQNFEDVDPILVRIATYALLHQGRIQCQALERELLEPSTIVEPV